MHRPQQLYKRTFHLNGNRNSAIGHDIHNRRNESEYKAAPGEILAKDSILYSHKPGSRQLRRQLWPIMEEIANGVAVGAKMIKQMVRPIKGDYYRKQKERNIKNIYLSPSSSILLPTISSYHPKPSIRPMNMIKPIPIVIDQKPVRTISEDYVLHFGNNPNYVLKTAAKNVNPYADMGVTGYKHFEETVLRELEEKEEAKVEATMKTTVHNAPKFHNLEEELISGVPYGGWKPVKPPKAVKSPTTEKPKVVSKLHTSTSDLVVKPVHEDVDEAPPIKVINGELSKAPAIQQQKIANKSPFKKTQIAKVTAASVESAASVPYNSTLKPIVVADMPNYPQNFLKRQHHRTKTAKQPGKFPGNGGLTATVKPILIEMQASHQSSVFVTPVVPTSFRMPASRENSKTRRLKQTHADASPTTTPMLQSGRGNIRFGDRLR